MPATWRTGWACAKALHTAAKRLVLLWLKETAFNAFEFNTDRIVIAVPAPIGEAPVPGAVIATDKLPQLPLALDIKMAGDFEVVQARVIGVSVAVQLVGKQLLHL